MRALYEAYDELLEYYEKPNGKALLQVNRAAAVENCEEEPPEFRQRRGLPPIPRSVPLLHPVPEALPDRRDIIRVEANPTLQREAEMAGELKV